MSAMTTTVSDQLDEAARVRLVGWPLQWEGYHWPGYCYEHTLRVRALALHLAAIEGADEEVVHLAATLHDICKSAGAEHAEMGASEARRILSGLPVHAGVRERACDAIATHCGGNTEASPLESRVLGDADLIDANFGLVAVARFITIRSGHDTPLPETIRSMAEWLPRKDAFLEVLLTSSGRQVARQRSARMHVFCDELLLSLRSLSRTKGLTLLSLAEAIHVDRGRRPLSELLDRLRENSRDGFIAPLALAALRSLGSEISGQA